MTRLRGNNVMISRWSRRITAADITGTTTQNFDDITFTDIFYVGSYIEVRTAPTSSDGNTTGLTFAVGSTADPDGIEEEDDLFGQAAGIIQSAGGRGALIGAAVASPVFFDSLALRIQLVATGGAPDLDHINACDVSIHLLYIQCEAEQLV